MDKGIRSLALKIGLGIILVELLALATLGAIYTRRFIRPLEEDLLSRVKLPAQLISSQTLTYNAAQKLDVLESLVGTSVLQSFVVSPIGVISYATDKDLLETAVADVEGVAYLDEVFTTEPLLFYEPSSWVYIAPLQWGLEGGISGYLYLEVSTVALQQQRVQIVQTFVMGSAVVIVLTSILIIVLLNNLVVRRVNYLLAVSQQVRAGNLSARASETTSQDELGVLQRDMNAMIIQLQTVVENLEQRVQSRTEDVERQSLQLQTVMDIGSAIVSIRDFDTLMNEVTRLISERFDFYHIGLFLLAEDPQFIILRASNSDLGKQMVARKVRLEVGGESLVGYVAGTREPRISEDVGGDVFYYDHPDLPDTRSEMALPLMTGGRLLGVLDIQSMAVSAFSQTDVRVLRVLADQVAVALDNARLVLETQEALEAQRRAYGEVSVQAWKDLVATQDLGYISAESGQVRPASSDWSPGMVRARKQGQIVQEDDMTVAVPIKMRGDEALGVVKFRRPEGSEVWTTPQLTLLETLTDRLGQAMENARLYEDSQRLADQERLVGRVTNRIRESLEVESVLQAAAQEIGDAFELADVVIRLGGVEDFMAQFHQFVIDDGPSQTVSEEQGVPSSGKRGQ